jgi:hypothetical protein
MKKLRYTVSNVVQNSESPEKKLGTSAWRNGEKTSENVRKSGEKILESEQKRSVLGYLTGD